MRQVCQQAVEDEINILLNCNAYLELRDKPFSKEVVFDDYFIQSDEIQQFWTSKAFWTSKYDFHISKFFILDPERPLMVLRINWNATSVW